MYQIFDILTIGIVVFFTYKSIPKFSQSSKYLYLLLFFLFYAVPLFLDYIIGFPNYVFIGYDESYLLPTTRIIYDVAIVFTAIVIYRSKDSAERLRFSVNMAEGAFYLLLIGMLIAPVLVLLMLKTPFMLYIPQWREIGLLQNIPYYSLAERFSYVGIFASCFVLLTKRKFLKNPVFKKVISLIFLYINICIEGKRASLYIALVTIVVIILYQSLLASTETKMVIRKTKRSLFGLFVLSSIVFVIMYYVSIQIHTSRGGEADRDTYTMSRVDFFRDDRIRMVIASETERGWPPILDSRLQTFSEDYKFIIPINFIIERMGIGEPFKYQHYFSAAVDGTTVSDDIMYMTTSFYAELLSNCGLIIGFILFPLFIIWLSRMTDKYPYPINLFIVISFVLLNMFDISYIMPTIEITLVLCYLYNKKIIR